MEVVSKVVAHSADAAKTPLSKEYIQDFYKIPGKTVLVGLDRNPKAAAVMTEGCYRAGMADTYAGDKEHYEVITDEAKAKQAIAEVQKRVHDALPRWVRQRDFTTGYEYLNLKEK